MTIDYYLSVPTEHEMPEIPEGATVDVIGTWSERTGGTDEEPVMTVVPGWHFNVRSAELIQWPESVTLAQPETPWRVWG